MMLTPLVNDVWTLARPLRMLGLDCGTRMTVIRLASGGLFVHSPVALDDALRAEIDALGPVETLVAPCLFHHLFIGDWARAYPDAAVLGAPGLEKKRTDVAWTAMLPDARFGDEIAQVFFSAYPLANEVVFFHRASQTMISSDVIFNLSTHSSGFTRFVARLIGNSSAGPTVLERLAIKDRPKAREQVNQMIAWDPARIVVAHGDIVGEDGKAVLERGYRWL